MGGFDEGIRELIGRGWRFQHLKDDAGNVVVLVGSFAWAEYYDRLHVYAEDEATAARAVMDSRPGADEIVWSYQGDALTAIKELSELPKPHEPNAPRLAKRAPLGLWLPGAGRSPFDLPELPP